MLEILLSSRVRAKLLTAFFLSPGVEHNAFQLARTLNESYSAVWKELNKLEGLGILKSEQEARLKRYQVDLTCPFVPELRSIIFKTEGVWAVIRDSLTEMNGVKSAFIYGSYASGEADKESDIDILIIGKVNLEQLADLIGEAEKKLNRPINYVIYSETEWRQKILQDEPFAVNVIQSPKIMLTGEKHAL